MGTAWLRTTWIVLATCVVASGQPIETAGAAADAPPRFGVAEPKPKTAGAIRVATYNVENLFDDHDDPAISDNPGTPGNEEDATMTKPAEHRAAAAAALRRLDADIVALQEIESIGALLWFRDEYLGDLGYGHAVSLDSGDGRGIENAVLSRFPVVEARVWPGLPLGGVHPEKWGNQPNYSAGEPLDFRRSPLLVTVEVPVGGGGEVPAGDQGPPYRLTLVVMHHKSGSGGSYWREAEAAKTVEIIGDLMKQDPERNVLVLGDFNAMATAKSVRMYAQAGLVDTLGEGNDREPARITHESGRRIDYVLANVPAMREVVAGSAFVLGTPARPEGVDWRTVPPPPGYASDHYPVAVDLIPVDK